MINTGFMLAELPPGWVWTCLGDIRKDNSRSIIPNNNPSSLYELYSVPSFDTKHPEIIKGQEIGSNKITVDKNTVLLCKINPRINRVWIVKNFSEYNKIASTEWIPFFELNEIYPEYLSYFMQTSSFRDFLAANTSGVGGSLMRTNATVISTHPLPLPPLPEQHRIVAKIEELFSELDKGVEALKTAQQQLKIYRQAVLKWAFEGKLTGNAGKNKINVKLAELCDFITKGTTPLKGNLYQGIGDVPFIKVYNLTFSGKLDFSVGPTFVTNETHNGFLARSRVLPGDVLMNIVGPPLGKVSIVPNTYPEWNINQAIVRFRCKQHLSNKFLAHFLLASLNIEKMKKKSKATAGQFNLTLEICRDIEIPLFSIEEQEQIVQEIEARLSVADKIEETIAQSLKQAEALRQSILKKAFSGKLVPQDPNDESAEKLLARIRAERTAQTPLRSRRRPDSRPEALKRGPFV